MNIIKTRSELLKGKTIYDLELNVGYYARVSTDKDDQLNSLENQANYFRDMINDNKTWHLVGEYIDEGISGTAVKKRDSFLKMIEDSKNGKLDLIVTKEISRFSRNTVDSIKYTEELLNNGTVVFFISDNINTICPDSEFRLALMSSLAQDEVRKLSERVKFGIQRMIKDGKLIGGNLTGYFRKNGRLIINESERPIIEILFNLYATGKYSFDKISRILKEKGYVNKMGKPYSGTTLKKFLTNPRYKGFYTANLTKVENYKTHKKIKVPKEEQIIYKDERIPKIVSEELWNRANSIYEERHKKRNINITASQKSIDCSKYTNKLICQEHQSFFIRMGGSNRRHNPIWICREYKKNGVLACNSPIIKEKSLDRVIESELNILINKYKQQLKEETINLYQDILKEVMNNEQIKLKEKIQELMKNRERLINLNLNSIIDENELKMKLNRLNEEVDRLKKEEKTINKRDEKVKLSDIVNYLDYLLDIKYHLNKYIDLFVEKIIVIKKDNRYHMNLEIIFKDNCCKKIDYVN